MDSIIAWIMQNLTTILSSIISFLAWAWITYSVTKKMNVRSVGSTNTSTQSHSWKWDNIGRDKNINN